MRGQSPLSGDPGSACFPRLVAIHANLPHASARRNHPACKGFTLDGLKRRKQIVREAVGFVWKRYLKARGRALALALEVSPRGAVHVHALYHGRRPDVQLLRSAYMFKAGLRKIRWHDLRHSFASQLVTVGVPIRRVQDWLGHSTIAMTMRYSHLAPGSGSDFVQALENPAAVATTWQRENPRSESSTISSR